MKVPIFMQKARTCRDAWDVKMKLNSIAVRKFNDCGSIVFYFYSIVLWTKATLYKEREIITISARVYHLSPLSLFSVLNT